MLSSFAAPEGLESTRAAGYFLVTYKKENDKGEFIVLCIFEYVNGLDWCIILVEWQASQD